MMRVFSQNCARQICECERHTETAYQSPASFPESRSNNRVSVCGADKFRENSSERYAQERLT
jgi:hypothetical protein